LTKPFKLDELAIFVERALSDARLRRETARMRRELEEGAGVSHLVGEGSAMQRLRDAIRRFADADAPALILGETGTGKSAVARAIHVESARAFKPFISVNCAAIPASLLESELFGHVRGAFTGATTNRAGLFDQAKGGTLFLDEIAELSPALQAKLLHVLERSAVRPVGSDVEIATDVRLLAATNQDISKAVEAGALRQDLVYRLDVLSLTVPPLRDRLEDLPLLVNHFLAKALAHYPSATVRRFSPEAVAALERYSWPGNIRELSHLVHSTALLSRCETVTPAELPTRMGGSVADSFDFGHEVLPIREVQRNYAVWAVGQFAGSRTQAAQRLGIDIKTLRSWLEQDEAPARTSPELPEKPT
jgi:two-component system, NtrC family, response regulator HydG